MQVDPDQQEALVVPEADVVARAIILDQLPLGQQRFRLVAHDQYVHIPHAAHEPAQFWRAAPQRRITEIGLHALAQ